MKNLHAEVSVAQLCKNGEELCGDKVEISHSREQVTVVLSDGLGSGVKANILATLTTKIASSMLGRGISMDDVVDTIARTLPVCRERKIAYATFHILTVTSDGLATVIEFDCPKTLLLRAGRAIPFPTDERIIGGKTVQAGQLALQEGDMVVLVSDGIIHAGIGGLLPLGWGWKEIANHLELEMPTFSNSDKLCQSLLGCCEGYYLGKPGDDSTVVALKLRKPRQLTLMVGPPSDTSRDEAIVLDLISRPGVKVVSGGTTANIVSRVAAKALKVDLTYHDSLIPPIGYIEGIDLVTEGVLTLNAAVERLESPRILKSSNRKDGATLLAKILMDTDHVDILAGGAVNPAHQNPLLPAQMNIKFQVLSRLRNALESLGKIVAIEWV